MTKTFFAIIVAFLFIGCYYDVESELYGATTCDIPASVTYSEHIKPIVDGKCATAGCHVQGGTGVGLLTTYDEVMIKVNDGTFEQETVIDFTMPTTGPLPTCEIQLIEAWIAAGSPQ